MPVVNGSVAHGQFRLRFNGYIALPALEQAWLQQVGHRAGIVKWRTGRLVLRCIVLIEETEHACSGERRPTPQASDSLNAITGAQHLMRYIEAHNRQWSAALKHHLCRLGVDEDIELG